MSYTQKLLNEPAWNDCRAFDGKNKTQEKSKSTNGYVHPRKAAPKTNTDSVLNLSTNPTPSSSFNVEGLAGKFMTDNVPKQPVVSTNSSSVLNSNQISPNQFAYAMQTLADIRSKGSSVSDAKRQSVTSGAPSPHSVPSVSVGPTANQNSMLKPSSSPKQLLPQQQQQSQPGDVMSNLYHQLPNLFANSDIINRILASSSPQPTPNRHGSTLPMPATSSSSSGVNFSGKNRSSPSPSLVMAGLGLNGSSHHSYPNSTLNMAYNSLPTDVHSMVANQMSHLVEMSAALRGQQSFQTK